MSVPSDLSADVRQFVKDFERVTALWVRDGTHSAEEVQEWRGFIRADMQSAIGANSAIDARPQRERIRAWCGTFAEIVVKLTKRGLL